MITIMELAILLAAVGFVMCVGGFLFYSGQAFGARLYCRMHGAGADISKLVGKEDIQELDLVTEEQKDEQN